MTTFTWFRDPKPWQPPIFTMPLGQRARNLRQLGELPDGRGRPHEWFDWQGHELEATDTLNDLSMAPDGPFLIEEHDGIQFARIVKIHAPGTYAARKAAKPKPPESPKASRPVDVLVGLSVLRFKNQEPGEGYVVLRGAQIVEKLKKLGVTRVDHSWVYLPPAGKRDARVGDAMRKAVPLLRGDPCFSCGARATTVAEAVPADLAWCGEWPCAERGKVRRAA